MRKNARLDLLIYRINVWFFDRLKNISLFKDFKWKKKALITENVENPIFYKIACEDNVIVQILRVVTEINNFQFFIFRRVEHL